MSAAEKRSVARTALAITVCLALAVLLFGMEPSGIQSEAQAQASPTPSGYTIEWMNPDTDTSTEVSAQSKTGQQNSANYHLVAWTNRLPADAFVEFCIDDCNPTSERITPEGTGATRVGDDTWEHFWSTLPAEGAYTLTARFFSGGTLLDTDTVAVTVNNVQEAAPPNSVTEGVEIIDPENGGDLGFYRPPGDDLYTGIIDVASSAEATVIEGKYSVSAPGTEPIWKSCGFETKGDAEDDGIRCELDEGETPDLINGVAAVAYDDPSEATADQPAQVQSQFRDGADAHRMDGYVQVPETLTLDFMNTDGSSAGDNSTTNPGTCSPVLRATVTDQNDEPVPDVNVDLHARGPDDDIRFVAEDTMKAPDQGGHTTSDPAGKCDGTTSGTQGEHDSPADDDTKHVESTDNTDDAGHFSVKLFHANSGEVPGTTQISAWADLDGNDAFCSQEPNDNAAIGWSQAATATGTGSETSSCTLPGASPSPSFTQTASPSTPAPTGTSTTSSTITTTTSTTTSQRVATNLSLRYRGAAFTGTASSNNRRCRAGRKVQVKKVRGGRDLIVGTDRTSRSGDFRISEPRRRGRYYAVVAEKRFTTSAGTTVICGRDRSRTIRVR